MSRVFRVFKVNDIWERQKGDQGGGPKMAEIQYGVKLDIFKITFFFGCPPLFSLFFFVFGCFLFFDCFLSFFLGCFFFGCLFLFVGLFPFFFLGGDLKA